MSESWAVRFKSGSVLELLGDVRAEGKTLFCSWTSCNMEGPLRPTFLAFLEDANRIRRERLTSCLFPLGAVEDWRKHATGKQ